MGSIDIVSHYFPMQARYIDFFGLARPLHSFFFWALLLIISVSIFLRSIRQDASMLKSIPLLIVIIAGSSGILTMAPVTTPSRGMAVDLPETGRLNMEPGQVYQVDVNGNTKKTLLRMTEAGPIVAEKSTKGLTVFMPLKTPGQKASVRLCAPHTTMSVLALLLESLALLGLVLVLGIHLFVGKRQ